MPVYITTSILLQDHCNLLYPAVNLITPPHKQTNKQTNKHQQQQNKQTNTFLRDAVNLSNLPVEGLGNILLVVANNIPSSPYLFIGFNLYACI